MLESILKEIGVTRVIYQAVTGTVVQTREWIEKAYKLKSPQEAPEVTTVSDDGFLSRSVRTRGQG